MYICRICGGPNSDQTYRVREMMLGTADEFDYFVCSDCGCLQIAVVPLDLAKYYSNGYYSLNEEPTQAGPLKRFLKRQRSRYGIGEINILGLLAAWKFGLPVVYEWAKKAKINFTSRILDVGCGKGFLLLKLKEEGFTDLTGIDPYLDTDITGHAGLNIYKKEIAEVDGEFDFVMLNHSFEHMDEPLSVLKEIYRVLKRDRYALIRIPVIPSYAWRTYGVNWVQLDAPRHLFLHTVQSMKFLAEKTGFEMKEIVYDSSDLQFWGSELYCRNTSMTDYQRSIAENSPSSMFSANDLYRFKEKARELNALEDGDQACFYLWKS
jgi:SAM-dependent methyltransferase